jgi:hypothetical protein
MWPIQVAPATSSPKAQAVAKNSVKRRQACARTLLCWKFSVFFLNNSSSGVSFVGRAYGTHSASGHILTSIHGFASTPSSADLRLLASLRPGWYPLQATCLNNLLYSSLSRGAQYHLSYIRHLVSIFTLLFCKILM